MNREQFLEQNEATWRELEALLLRIERREKPENADELPRLFRQVCRDLATAQHRMYGIPLIDRLNALVARGYKEMYRDRGVGMEKVTRFFIRDFPRAVRREWRLFWLCNAVFWLPFLGFILAGHHAPEWIHAILGHETMAQLDESWGHDTQPLDRGFSGDLLMFGHYIANNIGIDFRMFAGGILFGVGTLFFLLFNGIHIGAVAGYVHMSCDAEKFYSFVSGHSSYELIGMIVAGIAGMKLGLSLLRPGRLTRKEALVAQLPDVLVLIIGAGLLTFLAAIVEGFWSAHDFPPMIKYAVGIAGWVLLGAYLFLAGRGGVDPRKGTSHAT